MIGRLLLGLTVLSSPLMAQAVPGQEYLSEHETQGWSAWRALQ